MKGFLSPFIWTRKTRLGDFFLLPPPPHSAAVSVLGLPPDPAEVLGDAAEDAGLVEVGAAGPAADGADDKGAEAAAAAHAVPAVQGASAVALRGGKTKEVGATGFLSFKFVGGRVFFIPPPDRTFGLNSYRGPQGKRKRRRVWHLVGLAAAWLRAAGAVVPK